MFNSKYSEINFNELRNMKLNFSVLYLSSITLTSLLNLWKHLAESSSML